MISASREDNITVLMCCWHVTHEYLWSESESPAGSHRTAEDDFVHVEWNMIMAPVTTERIAAPIYLPVRPAAEVIGEWREDSFFIEPDKTRRHSAMLAIEPDDGWRTGDYQGKRLW